MVWFDVRLFAGTYRSFYFLLFLLPIFLLDLVIITVCTFLYLTTRWKRRKDGNNTPFCKCCTGKEEKDPFTYYPMKKMSFDEMSRGKKFVLEPVDDFDFDNSTPKPATRSRTVIIWMPILTLAYTGIVLVIFDFWPVYLGLPLITLFLWLAWMLLLPNTKPLQLRGRTPLAVFEEPMYKPGRIKLYFQSLLVKAKHRPCLFWGGMLCWFMLVFIGCFFGNGICITAGDPLIVSTRFTRSFMPNLCPGPAPCHVYLTLPESTSDSVIIHFQTPNSLPKKAEPRIYYDISSHRNRSLLSSYKSKEVATTYVYKSTDLERSIHWVVLSGLKPDTQYFFRVGYVKDNTVQDNEDAYYDLFTEEKSFVTGPESGKFSFIAGGDLSISPLAEEMLALAGQYDPLFVMLGGDLAYANGMETCYRSWDIFLNNYEKNLVSATTGNMIPLILAVGNHEGGGYLQSLDHLPFYIRWFAQSRINQAVKKRLSYHVHTVSNNTLILALDSMISAKADGEQLDWMKSQLESFAPRYPNRLPLYHVPLYPSVRSFDNTDSQELRKYWGPVFDSYNVSVAFENHDHAYKRTKPLRNNQIDPTGTLYVGDGAFGVRSRSQQSNQWFIEKSEPTTFFLKVDVEVNGMNTMTINTIGRQGVIIDTFSKNY